MPQPAPAPYRIPWIDYQKGFIILYVVLTHVNDGIRWKTASWTDGYDVFYHWMDMFPMPLFFFMSGMFIQSSVDKPYRGWVENRFRTGVYPFVVWVILFTLMTVALGRFTNSQASFDPIKYMWVDPPYHYWFVYALVMITLLWTALRKSGVSSGVVLFIFFLLYAYQDLLRFPWWKGLHFIGSHGLYVAFGAYLGTQGFVAKISQAPTRALVLLCVSATTAIYAGTNLGMKENEITFLPVLLCSLMFAMSLCTLLNRYRLLRFVEGIGRRSLAVYLTHVFATAGTRIVLQKGFGIENVPVHVALGVTAGIVIPALFYDACMKLNFPHAFSLPPRRRASGDSGERPRSTPVVSAQS